jgi:uncharacterized membrane protein SpoIIM required for sporulation
VKPSLISTSWLDKHRPHWARLEELVEQCGRRGVSALDHRALQELGLLYRQIASDLSVLREDPTSQRPTQYLNQLLGRAHNLIYMGRRGEARGILDFYRETYPQIFRATLRYTLAAFAVFLAGAAAGFLACLHDPSFSRYLLGERMIETIERREMWTHSILTMKPVASSQILTNNLTVSFATFAFGITAGIGTVYMVVLNGVLIGVIAAACAKAGMSLQFWSFVAPHGVLELPAIFIASGAGLVLARGLLFPGWMPRRDSLVRAGGEGVRLVLGSVPLLLVAGFIEGFVSPSGLPALVKFVAAGAIGGLLGVYLMRGARGKVRPDWGAAPERLRSGTGA